MSKQKNIRNFCIIAHIDHGKSTLADRFLEITKTVEEREMKEQFLDQMDIERERGITIKLQPIRMKFNFGGENYILNLIDTPGHVDFCYEVSRSLAAVEGVILLIDAAQGIQAQTLSNLYLALEQNLVIIPVINKIDMPNQRAEEVSKEISELVGNEEEILKISAKTGENVKSVLRKIVEKIPPPSGNEKSCPRALIFDSYFDSYKGVIAQVKIVDGKINRGDKIYFIGTKTVSEVMEIGIMSQKFQKTDYLKTGEIGYIATGLKEISSCSVGDTITNFEYIEHNSSILKTENLKDKNKKTEVKAKALPGYRKIKSTVFACIYSVEDEYIKLKKALEKLRLNDSSLFFEPENSNALGNGFLCGFLGMLHLEIVTERLKREYGVNVIITTPSVPYKVIKKNGETIDVFSPSDISDQSIVKEIQEPWSRMEIIAPKDKVGSVMKLAENSRAVYKGANYISERVIIEYEIPLSKVIIDFYDNLKSASKGFASMNYDFIGFKTQDLVKIDVLVSGKKVDAFSKIVLKSESYQEGRKIVKKLKNSIERQNFSISLQAAISGKIIARETIKPFRKDVTSKLYGGDVTRKRKLLEKQKKGKKKMKSIGKINIPPETFLAILKRK